MSEAISNSATIKRLNTFLRGELSAVETYDQVLKKIPAEEVPELALNRDCHFRRTQLLSNTILTKGGSPEIGSGAWGAMAQAATGSATMFGRDAMIAILEEGEDRGLAEYRAALSGDDEEVRQLIGVELLPAQKRTHGRMSELQKRGAPKGKQATRTQ